MTNVEKIPEDVTQILSEQHLSWYVKGYEPNAMNGGAEGSLISAYPYSKPLVQANSELFYKYESHHGDPLNPAERELSLIGTLATGPKPLFLAIHIYWGLCVGLSPNQIAGSILLSGMYHGISTFSSAIAIMQKTMTALELLPILAEEPKKHEYETHQAIPSMDVVRVLKNIFDPAPEGVLKAHAEWFQH